MCQRHHKGYIMKDEKVTVRWTWEAGRIWATCSDGRRIPTWLADPGFACFAELLNLTPGLGTFLLSAWLDDLDLTT